MHALRVKKCFETCCGILLGPQNISCFESLFIPDFFGIRERTGHIYVKKDLVGHAREEPYRFQVIARDEKGTGPFTNTAFVEITILPAANSPPVWVIPPKDNATIEVLEVCWYKNCILPLPNFFSL